MGFCRLAIAFVWPDRARSCGECSFSIYSGCYMDACTDTVTALAGECRAYARE